MRTPFLPPRYALPGGLLIVPPESAACGVGGFARVDGADHVSIAKPEGRGSAHYRMILDAAMGRPLERGPER